MAARFDALLRYVSLRLGRQLGAEVTPALSRRERQEPASRTQALVAAVVASGALEGAIRIPQAVGPVVVVADLRAGRISCHVDIDAPREGRATTRVNWLLRQLRSAPDGLRVESFAAHSRGPGPAELLSTLRQDPTLLVADAQKELRAFRVTLAVPAGTKRGRGRGSFIDSVLGAIDTFYGEVVQNLKAWSAAPPRLRDPSEPRQPVASSLVSTALSSQDGAEPKPPQPPEAAETPPVAIAPAPVVEDASR
ncbi:hypothetical protein [Flindersiella endophytica]